MDFLKAMPINTPIDIYIAAAPEHYKKILAHMRDIISACIPGAHESISYGIPTFKVDGNAVGGFAAFKGHCSFFPFSGSLLRDFKKELAEFGQTKSAVHFTPQEPIPDELIKRMVKAKLLVNSTKT